MSIIVNDWWISKRKKVKEIILGEFNYSTPMKVSDIEKIVLNSGVSASISDKTFLDKTKKAMGCISFGQSPVITYAKKSITNFKLREGMAIGCKVTLRKKRMWDFLFELINFDLIRIPNFRGLSKNKFDKFGNYNFGLESLGIFPSIPYELIFRNQGLQVTIVFKSSSAKDNFFFLELIGFPFIK